MTGPEHPGHHDHRRMHEERWSRERALEVLEGPERTRQQDPRAFWQRIGLGPGQTVVDVGAGSGFFAWPAAEIVGPTGRVYAVDVSSDLVDLVGERARERKLGQVTAVLSTPERIPVASHIADVVLLANLLHGVPPTTVAEALRLLRPGGRFVNVDWVRAPTEGGPPVEHRLTPDEATRILESYGLRRLSAGPLGPSHYVLVFERAEGRERSPAPSP